MSDIISEKFGNKIRTRVCGWLLSNDRLLLVEHRGLNASDSFWAPPGGEIHFGETTEDALIREFKEETGISISVSHFSHFHEFVAPPLHAIELFFCVEIKGGELLVGIDPELSKNEQIIKQVKWFDFENLSKIPKNNKHKLLENLKNWTELFANTQRLT